LARRVIRRSRRREAPAAPGRPARARTPRREAGHAPVPIPDPTARRPSQSTLPYLRRRREAESARRKPSGERRRKPSRAFRGGVATQRSESSSTYDLLHGCFFLQPAILHHERPPIAV